MKNILKNNAIKKINTERQYNELENILLKDKVWVSDVLVTIENDLRNYFDWYIIEDSSAIMIGKILRPTPIFILGKIDYAPIRKIIKNFKNIKLQTTALHNDMEKDYIIKEKYEMIKMELREIRAENLNKADTEPVLLSKNDIKNALNLYIENGGNPNEFDAHEFANGIYYGIKKQNIIISMAGTQIRSEKYKTAVIGNVITKQSERGKGYATVCLINLINKLKEKFETITLNADKNDINAIKLYEKIGFKKYTEYFELLLEKKEI